MPRVFMGGTTNNSTWRDQLASILKIEYTDPVVKNWTPDDKERELQEREMCDYILYVITPKIYGFYSIAELIDDSNKQPNRTLFCILDKDVADNGKNLVFTDKVKSSLESVATMARNNGAKQFNTLQEIAAYLNDL